MVERLHLRRDAFTGERGIGSGRPRVRVECLLCRVVVHSGTTGPDEMWRAHVDGVSAYERAMTADEPSAVTVPRAEWEALVEAVRVWEAKGRREPPTTLHVAAVVLDEAIRDARVVVDAARALVAAVGGREAP